jgi:TRAP-type C4-dicarboxylate transport system permease small subunit
VPQYRASRLRTVLSAGCGLLAAVALFAIMALTLVDVSGRKLLSQSVPGSLELTELLMVLVIFGALPLVSLRGEHVVFDSLDAWLPAGVRRLQQGLVDAVCMLALLGLAWLMWEKGLQMAEYGDTTAQLLWPLAPFVYVMAVLCALTGLVHGLLLLRPWDETLPGDAAAPAPVAPRAADSASGKPPR